MSWAHLLASVLTSPSHLAANSKLYCCTRDDNTRTLWRSWVMTSSYSRAVYTQLQVRRSHANILFKKYVLLFYRNTSARAEFNGLPRWLKDTIQGFLGLFHTADTDKTRLSCLVCVGGVNWTGYKKWQFSVVLNIFETEQLQILRIGTKQNCLILLPIKRCMQCVTDRDDYSWLMRATKIRSATNVPFHCTSDIKFVNTT